MSNKDSSPWVDSLLKIFTNIFLQLAIWATLLCLSLTLFYGKFPPPIGKIRGSLSQLQAVMAIGPDEISKMKSGQVRAQEAIDAADPEGANSELKTSSPLAQSENPTAPGVTVGEIQRLKFKTQTLEARLESLEAELAKLKNNEKPRSQTVNR